MKLFPHLFGLSVHRNPDPLPYTNGVVEGQVVELSKLCQINIIQVGDSPEGFAFAHHVITIGWWFWSKRGGKAAV